MLNMLGKCPQCNKPTVSKGMSCDSCLGEAHRPRPKRRAKAPPAPTTQMLPAPLEGTVLMGERAVKMREVREPDAPIVEPPVYSSRPPTVASEGRKFDQKKPRPALFPPIAMLEVGHVLAYGAEKYTLGDSPGQHNWKLVPNAVERYSDAMLRHIYAWLGGEKCDPEHGRHHLASVICCAAFILWFELTGRDQ